MSSEMHLPWRAPLFTDWHQRCKKLKNLLDTDPFPSELGEEVGVELRRLAGQRLGGIENVKLNQVAKKAFSLSRNLSTLRSFRLAVIGNRTLDFFSADICGAGLARGLLIDTVLAPYDSIVSIALENDYWDTDGHIDAVLLMFDDNLFQRTMHLLDDAGEKEKVTFAINHLRRIISSLRTRLRVPVILSTLPLRPEIYLSSADHGLAGSSVRFIDAINSEIIDGGRRGDWIVFDLAKTACEVGTDKWFDPVYYNQSKIPFALEFSPLAADRICSILAAIAGKSGRALVLDLDNTVWGGVIGDDGLEGIQIGQGSPQGEAFLAIQRLALQLHSRGVVLAVCSKNEESTAKLPFLKHPDMLLKLEHIAVFQANWRDKASNVQAIAQTLNLGIDSLVFVDDNPAERERVRQELPSVQVPELGEDAAFFPRIIVGSGVFEHLMLNKDDLARSLSYQVAGARAEIRDSIDNYDDYLKSLEMRLTISPFDKLSRARVTQLVSKSNQFNLTTRRYNEIQIEEFENKTDTLHWQIRLSDVFGDHGMISVVIVNKMSKVWHIDSWLMSCRVLKRGVEDQVMNELFKQAALEGIEVITGEYIPTNRNVLVENFYDNFGFKKILGKSDDAVCYELKVTEFVPKTTQIKLV